MSCSILQDIQDTFEIYLKAGSGLIRCRKVYMSFTDKDYKLLVRLRNENINRTAENAFGFHNLDTPTSGPIWGDLVGCFMDGALVDYLSLISNNWFIESMAVVEMTSGTIVEEEGFGTSTAGNITGDPMPAQVAAVISWRTARTGRRGKGRTYLPPAGESYNDSVGVITGSYLTLMDTFAGALESFSSNVGANDGTYAFAIMSEADQSWHQVTSHISRNIWCTQRGRAR